MFKNLFRKRKDKSHDENILTFTKKWVGRILWFGIIWITWSYVLASFGKTEIAENLSVNAMKIIISTVLMYLTKAYFETYSEKKNELKLKEMEDTNHDVYDKDEDYEEGDL